MARLVARSACEGLLPLAVEGCAMTEVVHAAITSVMPFAGQQAAVSKALAAAVGLDFPAPNTSAEHDGIRIVWTGRGQAMVLGGTVAPEGAATTDQTDAWAAIALEGPLARAVLARLVPVDLRRASFPDHAGARTLLGHMTCTLICTGPDSFEILVFRSMAATAVHELHVAMKSVAAQA